MRHEFVDLHAVGIEVSHHKWLMFHPNCCDTKMFVMFELVPAFMSIVLAIPVTSDCCREEQAGKQEAPGDQEEKNTPISDPKHCWHSKEEHKIKNSQHHCRSWSTKCCET